MLLFYFPFTFSLALKRTLHSIKKIIPILDPVFVIISGMFHEVTYSQTSRICCSLHLLKNQIALIGQITLWNSFP